MARSSLSFRLTASSLALAVTPLVVVGLLGFYQLHDFSTAAISISSDAMEQEGLRQLQQGANHNAEQVETLIRNASSSVRQIAYSANLESYLSALEGSNSKWNELAQREPIRIVNGLLLTCQTQQGLLEKTQKHNLSVARCLLEKSGGISLAMDQTEWQAINQYSKQPTTAALPCLEIGGERIEHNATFDKPSPLVDRVTALVGGTCTIFQRMNDAGDMLRVATTVKLLNGNRAIGTYIPVVNPDGKPNPVVQTVMSGKTYLGRAYVVNAWCITSYVNAGRKVRRCAGG